ncbi:hypothetical protein [Roseibium polysiphoniae]|uniref:Uncharacterized protein n=1 Tax=Roseibium polysiphoniae TaxID=2571221 RepID=A0ABR9C4C4_9HYPH|nr:hypothetical protein [Roseibium polysiphoniae]MBD8874679.1 hypothetical protein [Roseibium polysiphoniae]
MRLPLTDTPGPEKFIAAHAAGIGYSRLGLPQDQIDGGEAQKGDATPVTSPEVQTILLYLRKTRKKAETVRENAPAGSYLDGVLSRTIAGIDQEISQLRYLLNSADDATKTLSGRPQRMRPAL